MRKKEIIQLIIEKSEAIELKKSDTSYILSQIKPTLSEVVVSQPKFKFRLKPFYLVTTGIFIFILTFALLYKPNTPIHPIDLDLGAYDDAILLSTLSTASLIEFTQIELTQTYAATLLSFGQHMDPKVTNEIGDLTKYLEMMEKLVFSQETYAIEKEVITSNHYQKQIRFKTKDLLNLETSYTLRYDEHIDPIKNEFSIQGEIQLGDSAYQMVASGRTDTKNQLLYRLYTDQMNYVSIRYLKEEDNQTYTIRIVQNNQLIESVILTVNQSMDKNEYIIEFQNGSSVGSYQFEMDTEDFKQVLRVNYRINGQSDETGVIIVRVLREENQDYQFYIQPTGKPPFTIDRGRQMSENRGKRP